jgi:hypothetical protein
VQKPIILDMAPIIHAGNLLIGVSWRCNRR